MIDDDQLDEVVCGIKQQMPDCGERMLMGNLQSRSVFVPRWRIRNSLHRVDPIHTPLRWRARIQRRPYSVPGPNSLWHLGRLICV